MKILLQRHEVAGPVRESILVWHPKVISFGGFVSNNALIEKGFTFWRVQL